MNAINRPLPLERHGYELSSALSGIAASTRSSPALDRAVAAIEAHAVSVEVRNRAWASVKLGAEIILADLQAGNPCTFERALAAPRKSKARRQADLAMRWRRRRGTKATPPTWRSLAARKSWEKYGAIL